MANNEVFGLAVGLDTSSLKAGLEDANRRIREFNAEFKAASSGLDDWAKSYDGVSAKLNQLNKTLNVQEAALEMMQKEYKEMYEGQDETSAAAVKLRTQILNQQAAINKTEKEFSNYKKILEGIVDGEKQADKVIEDTNKSLKDQDTAAENAGSSFGKLAGAVGSAAGAMAKTLAASVAGMVTSFFALAEGTRDYRNEMSKLDAAFAGSGHSAETAEKTYKSLIGIMGESDTAVEASQQIALLAESEAEAAKWAELAAGVTGTFGDALKPEVFYESANETLKLGSATGAFAQMLEGTGMSVDEFNKGLAACSTEAEKQAYMLEVSEKAMGKAGDAYRETNADVIAAQEAQSGLTDALANLGAIAEPVMTQLKTLATDLLTSFTPFVGLMGDGLTSLLAGDPEGANQLADGLNGIIDTLLNKAIEMIPMFLDIITTLAPKIITTIVEKLPLLIQTVSDIVVQIMNSLSEMLPELIPVIIDGLLMCVDTILDNLDMLIDAAISMIMALADGLVAAIPKLTEKIPTIITKLIDAISRNLPKIIRAGIDILLSLGSGLIKAIPDLLKSIPTIFTSLVSGFGNFKDSLKEIGVDLLKGLWEGIKDTTKWLIGKIKGLAGDITDSIKDFFGINSPSVLFKKEIGMNLGLGVGEGIVDSSKAIKKDINVFNKEVLNGFDVSANPIELTGSSSGNGGVVTNTNYTQIINAPKQPSIDELYRNTKNLFNLKAVTSNV